MLEANSVFKRVDVIPDWVRGHFIQWELDPFFKGVQPFNFSLEIAENINFSEILATKPNLGDTFYVVDDTGLKQNFDSTYVYRISLTTGDGKAYRSFPVLFGASKQDQRKYAMASKIIGREILTASYGGVESWLLRRKTHGSQRKTVSTNVDPVSGVPITDTKQEDYGVGTDGGYFDPIPCVFTAQGTTRSKGLDPNGIGVKESNKIVARLPGYPLLQHRDVICTAREGLRYVVDNPIPRLFPGTQITLLQTAELNLAPFTDTIYAIPIPIYVP